jgi:isoleucyl-tRNA synthetase
MHEFCSIKLGSLYLDVLKDRMYTLRADSHARLSGQTAMYHVLHALVRWMAPALSFTAEEIWALLPGTNTQSVFHAIWYEGLAPMGADAKLSATDIAELTELRDVVLKQLEGLRNQKVVGSSLDATVTLHADANALARLQALGDELRFFLIVSQLSVVPLAPGTDAQRLAMGQVAIDIAACADTKCVRCWHKRNDVGTVSAHPQLCARCADNVEGKGETRVHF